MMRRAPAWWGAALAGAVLVVACSSASLSRFEGKHITVALAELGPATRIVSYPFGGSVYIWEARFRELPRPSRSTAADDQPPPPQDMVDRTALLVNDSGLVTATLHDWEPRHR